MLNVCMHFVLFVYFFFNVLCVFYKIKAFLIFDFFFSLPSQPHVNLFISSVPGQTVKQPGDFTITEERTICYNDLNLKTIYREEMPYISAQIALSSFTHLYGCDLKANQMTVAVSQAEFGLCNVVFDWALVPEQKNPLNTHKADDPALFPKHPSALLFPILFIYFS